jgi:hypothetical protein
VCRWTAKGVIGPKFDTIFAGLLTDYTGLASQVIRERPSEGVLSFGFRSAFPHQERCAEMGFGDEQ